MQINKKEVEPELPVVNMENAEHLAYLMGEKETEGDIDAADLSYFKESARWCNVISTKLKSLAGADHDTKYAVSVEEPDDVPANGEVVPITFIYGHLVEAFDTGARGEELYE